MTDCTGMIQHAVHSLPDRFTGYTTDDNARALIAALKLYQQGFGPEALRLAEGYLSFLHYAQTDSGEFRNFMGYERRWLESEGSEDCFGRALWACAQTVTSLPGSPLARVAGRMMDKSMKNVGDLGSVRGRAFALMGLHDLVSFHPEQNRAYHLLKNLAESLAEDYRSTSDSGWYWFEDMLTYSNGILPMAMFLAYSATGKRRFLSIAVESLAFLTEVVFPRGVLHLVGNKGWYRRGGARALYDEQPVDAAAMVLACLAAGKVTGKPEYLHLAECSFQWFLGRNSQNRALYEPTTGGCYDGLTPDGVNLNQGAESLLAYMLANLSLAESRSAAGTTAARSGTS